MPGIWTESDDGWTLSSPSGFPDEATLHGLIERAPEMLPLSGAPQLLILGREVPLGSGFADLVGVETTGRPVIIEVKLAQNNEARRAVVSQILAYAASLHGTTREHIEERFGNYLKARGHDSLEAAVSATEGGAFDSDEFTESLGEHLREGRFRLVFVLDSVPPELMTLVAYLEHVTDKLVIDLVAVNAFDISGSSVVLPQRVTPERHEVTVERTRRQDSGTLYAGSERFEATISSVPDESQARLHRLLEWARDLERQGLVRLSTYQGKGAKRHTLLPRLKGDNVGLVTIWNDGGASLQFWRSVFEKRAPHFIGQIEDLTDVQIGQGNTVRDFNDELLTALTEAYRDASQAEMSSPPEEHI